MNKNYSIELSTQYDDSWLAEQCALRNREAQKALYEQYHPILLGVCMRYTGNLQEAEDVLHDSFIGIFGNIKKFKGKSGLLTWLTRVVINDCLMYLRKRKKLNLHYTEDMPEYEADDLSEAEIAPYNCNQLLEMISTMPTGYKTVLCLYSIDGMSHKEIGKMLNISESSSRSQLTRAREFLRELIKGKEEKHE